MATYNVVYSQGEGGIISGPSTVSAGGSITVTATPDTHYYLNKLTINSSAKSAGATVSGTTISNINSNIIIQSDFYGENIAVTYTQTTGGTISGYSVVGYGNALSIFARPDTGYHVDHMVASPSAGVTFRHDTLLTNYWYADGITENCTISAVFSNTSYNITYNTSSEGTVSGDTTVESNGSIIVTATPNNDYHFDSISINPSTAGTVDGLTISNINSDFSVSGVFSSGPYNITYTSSSHATVTGPSTAAHGDTITVRVTITPGYFFSSLRVGSSTYDISQHVSTFVYDCYVYNIHENLNISVNAPTNNVSFSPTYNNQIWIYLTSEQSPYMLRDKTITYDDNPHALTVNVDDNYIAELYLDNPSQNYITLLENPYRIQVKSDDEISQEDVSVSYRLYEKRYITYTQSTGGTISGPATVGDGGSITVTASPSTGYTLGSISSTSGTVSGTTVSNITADATISATWIPNTYTITYGTAVGGTISGDTSVSHGGSITVTASPSTGYTFGSISISPSTAGTVSGTTISNITGDITVTPTWTLNTYTVTYGTATGGTISGATTVQHGGSVAVTVNTSTGYDFNRITITPSSYGNVSGTTVTNVVGNITINPEWTIKTYTVSYQQSTGGNITGVSTVSHGGSITVNASPSTGYHLGSISSTSGTVSGTTVSNITSNTTISATWTLDTHTVSYTQSTGGTISGVSTVSHGGSITVTAEPDSGYELGSISATVGTVSGTTVSNITSNTTISATWGAIRNITYSQTTGGTISGPATVGDGGSITVTASPSTGYTFGSISISPSSAGTVSGRTISNISGDITVTPTWTLNTYSVAYNQVTGGTISGVSTVSHGGSITVTASPSTGYALASISISPSSAGTVSGTTVSNITGNIAITPTWSYGVHAISYPTVNHGVISGPLTAASGGSITVTVTPETGYSYGTIVVTPSTGATVSGTTISNITSNISVTTTFRKTSPATTYAISYQSVTGGSASGVSTVNYGGSFTVTFTANSGYHLSSWTTQGICTVDTTTNLVSNVYSNIVVIPAFAEDEAPGPTPPGTVYDLGWRPMWYDTNTAVSTTGTTNSVAVIAVINGNEYIVDDTYYCKPSLNTITVDLNKLVDNVWEAPAFNTTTTVRTNNHLRFLAGTRSGSTFTANYEWDADFVPDWSWTNVNFDNFNPLSKPFNNNIVVGQYIPYSVLQKTGSSLTFSIIDPDGTTTTYTPTANAITDYVIPINKSGRWIVNGKAFDTFCADYVLYYVNSFGGWDSIALEGNTLGSRDYDRSSIVNYKKVTTNYKNTISKSYLLRTGWMTDDQSAQMYNVFGSTRAILHDINNNKLIDVVISDTSSDDKTFKNQGRQLVRYDINVTERQIKTRR